MARVMTSRGPARSAPPGAPRPFENDTETTSKGRDNSPTDCPVATEAFHSLEPSRYVAMSSSRAAAHTSEASVSVTTTPPARLCVFSISTSVVGGKSGCPRGLRAARNSSAVNEPFWPISVIWTPALAADAPASCHTAWLWRLTTTSSPGRVSTWSATWFAIVPLGSQRPDSLPRRAAQRSWSSLMLGSSPN